MSLLVLLASSVSALAQDAPVVEPVVLADLNREVLGVLADPAATDDALAAVDRRLGQVFSTPERLAAVPPREEVGRYWQAHGLLAMHRGGDPAPALRLACLLDKNPAEGIAVDGFEDAFIEACGKPPPALVPLDLGELSAISVVWLDGQTHGAGQYVRSGQHLVQVTEDGALRSSRWMLARALPEPERVEPPPEPPAPPEVERRCSKTCRALRVGGVASLVVAGGLGVVAVAAAIEAEESDDDWNEPWADDNEGVTTRRDGAAIGAGVAAGAGLTGILISGRF